MPTHIIQGSDPEFSIADSAGACVPADRLLDGGNAQLGYDGRSDTGELRPAQGSTSRHLMNMRSLVQRFAEEHPTHQMLAGSRHFRQPLGGHIHFSGNPIRRYAKIVRALDAHLAMPLLILENKISARERRMGDYGHLGQYNDQEELHGGFEYRTPSSWLVSMNMAKMTLEIAMLIAYDWEKLLDSRGQAFIDVSDSVLRRNYSACDKLGMFELDGTNTNLWRIAKQAVRKLKRLPNAYLVMNSILTLENMIRLKSRWHQELDATKRWHLPERTLQFQEIEWNASLFDRDGMPIYSNGRDYACSVLVNQIKDILGEVGLEKKYYIYGILDRYGKDFAVTYSFSHHDARVHEYTIAEQWYGRARETAPYSDAILIGVSTALRQTLRREHTAKAITRMIRTIERL